MIAEQDPFIDHYLDLDPVQSLPPEDRALLTIPTGSGSIADLANQCGLDLLTLAERILAPEIQAALESVKQAATELSHVRALIGRPVALAALEAASTETNPNLIERRRAGSAFLRAAPTGYSHAPRGAGYPHAPQGAISVHHFTPATQSPPAGTFAGETTVINNPAPEPEAAQHTAPALGLRAPDTHIPLPAHRAIAHAHVAAEPRTELQISPDRPKPDPKSRDRPPNSLIPLARKPPLIAAA